MKTVHLCGLVVLVVLAIATCAWGASNARASQKSKVAIIGAGIGGATTAYYISEESKLTPEREYEIQIYEKNSRVGGRVRSFSIEDDDEGPMETPRKSTKKRTSMSESVVAGKKKVSFELGAAVWAAPNIFLEDLAETLSIKVDRSAENQGKDDFSMLVYQGGPHKVSYELELGDPTSLGTLRTAAQMEKFKVNLLENYLEFLPRDYGLHKSIEEHEFQEPTVKVPRWQTKPWTTLDEWARHGDIDRFTSASTGDYLRSYGVSQEFIQKNIEPFTRVIYDQGANANAFAGLVSMIAGDQTRAAIDGLQDMIARIIDASKATLHLGQPIISIEKIVKEVSAKDGAAGSTTTHDTNPAQIQYKLTTENGQTQLFDSVVIACPLEFLNIQFIGMPSIEEIPKREYFGKTSTYIRAVGLNTDYFGVPAGTDSLLTDSAADHTGVGFFAIVPHYQYTNGDLLFKVFSKQSMQDIPNSLQNWFVNGSIIEQQIWQYTFPDLAPRGQSLPKKLQPIILDIELYYTSAIDSVAVAMEASTWTAHNVAKLIVYSHLHGPKDPYPAPKFENQVLQTLAILKRDLTLALTSAMPTTRTNELFFLGYTILGMIYVLCGLSWLTPRFNFIFLLSVIFMGHVSGYWLEFVFSREIMEGTELHAQVVTISADIAGGILVALGTFLGDSILPMAFLSRFAVYYDWWAICGALSGLILWPILADSILSGFCLISRFTGGIVPSLSLLDVLPYTAVKVSIILILGAIVAAVLSSNKRFSYIKTLGVAFLLSFTHIGYLTTEGLLGTTSLWTRIIPSHVASFLHQDGFAAIVDPLSSTQTCILALVPCFLFGAFLGKSLMRLGPHSFESLAIPPRFSGPLRFIGAVMLIIGMAIHSGSYFFLTSFTLAMCTFALV